MRNAVTVAVSQGGARSFVIAQSQRILEHFGAFGRSSSHPGDAGIHIPPQAEGGILPSGDAVHQTVACGCRRGRGVEGISASVSNKSATSTSAARLIALSLARPLPSEIELAYDYPGTSIRVSTAKRIAVKWIRPLKCRSQPGHRQDDWIGGSENGESGSGGCEDRTVVSDGPKPQTFVRPKVDLSVE